MTCGQCGANIVVVSGGKYGKYGCSSNWNNGPAVCSNDIKIKKPEIEKAVLDSLNISLDSDGNISYLFEKVNSILKAKFAQERPKWKGAALGEQLKKLNKEISNFINAIKVGIITDTVKSQLINAEKKRGEIEELLTHAKKEMPIAPSVTMSDICCYLTDVHALLRIHPVIGRTLLSKIVDKISVEPYDNTAKVSIYCKQDGILGGKSFVTAAAASRPAAKKSAVSFYMVETLAA